VPDRRADVTLAGARVHIRGVTVSVALAEQPDSALIRRFLDGDEGAFRALYHRHTPRLRMVICRLLGARRDDADDLVQETWMRGCRGIHGFNGDAKFATWLTTIGVRAVYSRFSRHSLEEDQLPDELPEPPRGDMALSMDLERVIAMLPDHQRTVVVLHDVEGFTHQEIAKQLGVATGTSKATLSRARCTLRRLLSEGGVAHAG
jgi:RNA polymerase sigma-70 factor (ECF subfamily)